MMRPANANDRLCDVCKQPMIGIMKGPRPPIRKICECCEEPPAYDFDEDWIA